MQLMFSLFGLNMIKALKIAGNALAIARAVSDYFAGLNHVNPSKLNINMLFKLLVQQSTGLYFPASPTQLTVS